MAAYIIRSLFQYVVLNCVTYTHDQGPNNICSHTTELITVMYFNLLVTLPSTNNILPEDGDCTETYMCRFNVNFKIAFKTIHLCISWREKTFIMSRDAQNVGGGDAPRIIHTK